MFGKHRKNVNLGVRVYFGTDKMWFYGPFRDGFTAQKFAILEGAGESYRFEEVEIPA